MRALLDDAGFPLAGASYDAWGVPETPLLGSFGFTGELQQGSDVWLRARWYGAGRGAFGSRDPFEGWAETPYSLMPYQYAYAAPTMWTDASGEYACDFHRNPTYRKECASRAQQLRTFAKQVNGFSALYELFGDIQMSVPSTQVDTEQQ